MHAYEHFSRVGNDSKLGTRPARVMTEGERQRNRPMKTNKRNAMNESLPVEILDEIVGGFSIFGGGGSSGGSSCGGGSSGGGGLGPIAAGGNGTYYPPYYPTPRPGGQTVAGSNGGGFFAGLLSAFARRGF
jgi:hypothetical protein